MCKRKTSRPFDPFESDVIQFMEDSVEKIPHGRHLHIACFNVYRDRTFTYTQHMCTFC